MNTFLRLHPLLQRRLRLRVNGIEVAVWRNGEGRDKVETAFARLAGAESLPWAGVAQLVEHLICNQAVGGSNPFASSSFCFTGERLVWLYLLVVLLRAASTSTSEYGFQRDALGFCLGWKRCARCRQMGMHRWPSG